jgi:hypothetical protein
MARIVGGIGTSHVPTIGLAYDKGKQNDPAWAPLFKGYEPVAQWLAQRKPDVMVMFYNDHANSFFFDCYPTFALGVSANHEFADEGAGKRPLPDIAGHPDLAIHIAEQLVGEEFDLTIFQDRALDHGCNSPLSLMLPHDGGWPVSLVPLEVNVLQYPLPTANRCYRLGQALRRAIDNTDWLGLIRYGVCFFVLEKFARVVRTTNLGMYASMRGETLEAFLKTRRVPDAV